MGFSENNVTFKATFGEVYKVGGGGAVNSVNGKSGDVVLNASDVGAYTIEETDARLNSKADKSEIPTVPKKISDLEDDTSDLKPIKYAKGSDFALNSLDSDYSNYADTANIAQFSEKDYVNNVIHETYATKSELGTVEAIAKGRATGYVFDTVEDMNTWLENADNVVNLVLGDNLYVRATNVPDYWWDGLAPQPLETQKVDLSEYVKNTDYATEDKAGVVKVSKGHSYGVYTAGDNIIRIYGASPTDIKSKLSQTRPITPHRLEYAVEVCTNQDINAELTEEQLKLPPSTQTVKEEISKIGELIEEITITEEGIQTITRNAEPDGTPYNFKAVAIYQEAKPCIVDNTITFNGYSDTECKISLWSGQGRNTKTDAGRFISIWADVFAGSWYVLMNATTIQGSPTGVTGVRNMIPYNGEKTKSIKIQGYTTALEVGTKIQIYGVR